MLHQSTELDQELPLANWQTGVCNMGVKVRSGIARYRNCEEEQDDPAKFRPRAYTPDSLNNFRTTNNSPV